MSERPLDPRALANYILSIREHFGYETTNLELQKLAYFSYGKYLVSFNEKLCEGYFEAWEHGPVHPLMYREFKRYGSNPISHKAESVDLITGEVTVILGPNDTKRRTHIAETVLQLRALTASQLRRKSHAAKGPWHSVWESARVNLASQVIIPDNVIREGFNRHILAADDVDQSQETLYEDHPPDFNRSR
ncbi:type II toxin-antitoxin system antitoxin SocA domain-containing protein [Mameliella sp. AT18]|uniref:type II toxin-antitoxin system antitoxin SocA domain-containing protein n=1 Tax=Mameliella sp. AT18 TaxID=3028385 RepID=UPI0009F45520